MYKILETLETFVAPGAIAELRVIKMPSGKGFTANFTGFFDDMEKMADAAAQYDGKAPAVYFTLQRCKPSILARAANRMIKSKQGDGASDHEIARYEWFPIDIDADKLQGISSTDEEHRQAKAKAAKIKEHLYFEGWPEPVEADSGNGAHLCYKIDLENTPENIEIVRLAILAIEQRFSGPDGIIDRGIFNPSRIWKLYGTMACKGDEVGTRRHRRSAIISCPRYDEIETVSVELLKKLGSQAEEITTKGRHATPSVTSTGKTDGIDIGEWCSTNGLHVARVSSWKDGTKYQLTPCPFDQSHSEAILIKHPSGAVSFKCLHNGCYGKGWRELREMIAPNTQENMRSKVFPAKNEEIFNVESPCDSIMQITEELKMQSAGLLAPVDFPWSRLASLSNALMPGTLTVIAGPTKTGKSYFVMNLIKHIHEQGVTWQYFPLEDTKKHWLLRMLAIIEQDYRMTETDKYFAGTRAVKFDLNKKILAGYSECVADNPRISRIDSNGIEYVPRVSWENVANAVKKAAKNKRVVVVDPLAQIDFPSRDTYQAQEDFARRLLAIAASTSISIILVMHVRKRPGKERAFVLTEDDLQGSAAFSRLSHTMLLLDSCEMQSGEVYRKGGLVEHVQFNRILTIATARNGAGTRKRLAFLQRLDEPTFEELGVIKIGKGQK